MILISNTKKRICLGIESTAHTFSIGILDFEGNILSLYNDTYIPDKGGLHPQKVTEHHVSVFKNVLLKNLNDAKISIKNIDLIAFSQGPGLGSCLRIGAGIARTLAQLINIPIVGVNHCVAHLEIGRRICGALDPLMLYVSGGNTIISAFDNDKYRIFGETLDISIGNLLDMVARDLGFSHPGGPIIEKLAQNGSKYIELPYIVKGMDLSFSGIYTKCLEYIKSSQFKKDYNENDIAYSLQETAFAMLAEATERALAHTEKREVLLTGGVAANKRLKQMIEYISKEHGAEFYSVPPKLAGDNGAMIGWAGILYFLNEGGMKIENTKIDPKWRMDEVYIPWRLSNCKFSAEELIQSVKSQNSIFKKNSENIIFQNHKFDNYQVIKRGAEAILIKSKINNFEIVIKHRLRKEYRIEFLDNKIRAERTIQEAKILNRIKKYGIPVPNIFYIDNSNSSFSMDFIKGKPIKNLLDSLEKEKICKIFNTVGSYVGILHQNDEIHGDLTTSNIIYMENGQIFLIDFGLGYKSPSNEDKAVDLHLFKRVVSSTHSNLYEYIFSPFIDGYVNAYPEELKIEAQEIVKKIDLIELLGRYIKKEKRRKK